jgi:thiamine-phosphate pyrophosphorylase
VSVTTLLADRLRLIVLTDRALALPRTVEEVVSAALAAGAPAVQLRNKGDDARELLAIGRELRALTRASRALLFVNDRLDVALALEADGVHLGPDDIPVAAARRIAPAPFLIGRSADDVDVARRAIDEGADYIGCGAVYATSGKSDAGEIIGLDGLDRVARSVSVPVVAIGGMTVDRAVEVARTAASGIAVMSAVMAAKEPREVVRRLVEPFEERGLPMDSVDRRRGGQA